MIKSEKTASINLRWDFVIPCGIRKMTTQFVIAPSCPGLFPSCEKPPDKKPRTRRCEDSEENSGRARHWYRGYQGTLDSQTTQGPTGTWAQANGGKGGRVHSHDKRRNTKSRGEGRRDEWRRLAGGRCGQHPGGRRFAPGEEVGNRWKQKYG